MIVAKHYRQWFCLLGLFSLVALALLSPLASSTYLPKTPDFANHVGLIIQAKMALFSGQFPIRTAPWQHHGFYYPSYQFYSPLPYTLAAILYKTIIHSNPYVVFKLMCWLALLVAGVYMYRLVYCLTQSQGVGVLAAIAYMTAPYFIINIDVRAAFTEAFAQGLVPLCLYYSWRFMDQRQALYDALMVSLVWFVLLVSHIITFVYTSIFVALLFSILLLTRYCSVKKAVSFFIFYGFSFCLAAWFVVPIHSLTESLNIAQSLTGLAGSNWLTPLAGLFSFHAVSPLPLPGNGLLGLPLYPAIGWCFILGWLGSYYLLTTQSMEHVKIDTRLVVALQIIFCIAVFITWSPLDIWQYLPKFMNIAQFSYRFLTQTMWIGSLLLAICLATILQNHSAFAVAIGILVILLASSSWLPTNQSSPLTIHDVVANPDIGYGSGDYLIRSTPYFVRYAGVELPLNYGDGWLMSPQKIMLSRQLLADNPALSIHFEGTNHLDHPLTLRAMLDDQEMYRTLLPPGAFMIDIPVLHKGVRQQDMALEFLTSDYFIPSQVDAHSADDRHLAIFIKRLYFTPVNIIPVTAVLPDCYKKRNQSTCVVTTSTERLVQLPLLYYPKMLDIRVDDKPVSYVPVPDATLTLTGVTVPAGTHHIRFSFQGVRWANVLSLVSWLLWIVLLMRSRCRK